LLVIALVFFFASLNYARLMPYIWVFFHSHCDDIPLNDYHHKPFNTKQGFIQTMDILAAQLTQNFGNTID